METTQRDFVLGEIIYDLQVRDEPSGYFGIAFCPRCNEGTLTHELVGGIDAAFQQAEWCAKKHHDKSHQTTTAVPRPSWFQFSLRMMLIAAAWFSASCFAWTIDIPHSAIVGIIVGWLRFAPITIAVGTLFDRAELVGIITTLMYAAFVLFLVVVTMLARPL